MELSDNCIRNLWFYGPIASLSEEEIIVILSNFMIASSFITFFCLTFFGIRASYGRYSSYSLIKVCLHLIKFLATIDWMHLLLAHRKKCWYTRQKIKRFELFGSYSCSNCLVYSRATVTHHSINRCLECRYFYIRNK